MKATNIKWDIDFDDNGMLPTEIYIPKNMTDIDDVCDYLSDFTGYCHDGFDLTDAFFYEIFLDDLDEGNLVGDSGARYFHTEEDALADAKVYVRDELSEEYQRDESEFRIVIQHIPADKSK